MKTEVTVTTIKSLKAKVVISGLDEIKAKVTFDIK